VGIDVYTITALDANTAFVGSSPATGLAKIWKTTNGGTTWVAKDSVGVFFNSVHMFDANNGYAQGDPTPAGTNWILRRTTNGGETWFSAVTLPAGSATEAGWNNSMMWLNSTSGWFGTNNTRVYYTTNGGTNWLFAATNLSNANSFAVQFNALNTGLAAGQTGVVNRSTNGGTSWATGAANITGTPLGMTGVPGSQEFWSCSGTNVYYSSNFGTTWSTAPRNGYAGTLGINHVNHTTIGAAVYGWACGASGFVARFRRIPTDVEGNGPALPTEFSLSQNYPNPFNPTTRVKFDLPEQATVTLKVYNVLGQQVATLVEGPTEAGFHEVAWDGRNEFGSPISSGVYFYRFEATGNSGRTFATLKKMVFLK
jgi:hypothetical protein